VAAIVTALQARYGLAVSALTFLPIGYDSESAAYRVRAGDGADYFLKLRTGAGFNLASLAVPHALHARGLAHVLAPLPTLDRALWVGLDGYALSLYPFVEARTAAEAGLSVERWRILGEMLRRLHDHPLRPDLHPLVPSESFVPSRRSVIADLRPVLDRPAFADPAQRELAAFWRSRQDEIQALVDRADSLAIRLRESSPRPVVCHADLHTWNVLLDSGGGLWVVDWDETVLAPKERDLMFVIGGIGRDLVRPHETASFLQGYGAAQIDPLALAYYRYAWVVQEFGAYLEQVFLRPDQSEASRAGAVRSLKDMFEPGNIISIAAGSGA
jgi:spectinomycin phosphotransferase